MAEPSWAARAAAAALAAAVAIGCAHAAATQPPAAYGLGRAATSAEIARLDIDVSPDGVGLPSGHGDAAAGARVFAATCTRCHGEAVPLDPQRWPYATTLFDYVRRAMPPDRAMRLSADDLYAVTAYELAINGVIDRHSTLDRESLPGVTMPGLKAFFTSP